MKFIRNRLVLLLFGLGLLVWVSPSLIWYIRRMSDGSDEPFGIIALIAWAAFLPIGSLIKQSGQNQFPQPGEWLGAIAMVVALILAPDYPLIHAGIIVGFVSMVAIRRGAPPAILGLGILSLPVIATLEFYCGYPLRFACGWLGANLFNLFGLPVRIEGISMIIGDSEIVIDRPCSGLKYLWFGWFLTALVGSFYRLPLSRALALSLLSGLTLFLANMLRINLLFLLEWKSMGGSKVHEWVGLLVFALALGVILSLAKRLKPGSKNHPVKSPQVFQPEPTVAIPSKTITIALATIWCIFAVGGALLPETNRTKAVSKNQLSADPDFSQSFGLAGEGFANLLSGDNGEPQLFESNGSLVLLRRMARPSRSVHPAEDCFRGAGFKIEHATLWKDPYEKNWRRFYATRDGSRWEIRQRIEGADGWSGSDVSQWFWNATTGRSKGPWKMWVVVTEA